MENLSLSDIILAIAGSGGVLWFLAKKWAYFTEMKQSAKIEHQRKDQNLAEKMVQSELEEKENFQEKITFQLIERFLEQFSSYQRQNEKFQEFFFERLDPMLRAVQTNTDEVKRLITQSDVSQRTQRELTDSHKTLSAQLEIILQVVARDHPMADGLTDHVPPTLPAERGRVNRRRVDITSEEEEEQEKEHALN